MDISGVSAPVGQLAVPSVKIDAPDSDKDRTGVPEDSATERKEAERSAPGQNVGKSVDFNA